MKFIMFNKMIYIIQVKRSNFPNWFEYIIWDKKRKINPGKLIPN